MAREARLAAEKRRKRFRTARNVGIVAVIFVGGIVLFNVLSGGSSKKKASTTSTTVAAPTTTTPPITVDPAAVARVKCTDTKPPVPPKNTHQKAPAMTLDPNKSYTATISTSCGDIEVALDAKNAPKGVNNFVTLARQGFYDGLLWHRVVKNFVIQGGDPLGNGQGGPGYDIPTELPANGYPLGTLAWAKTQNAAAGSAGSQFFVVTSDRPASLEQKQGGSYQYGAFGQVTGGIEVAKKLEGFDSGDANNTPTKPIYIDKVTISES
jgi:cyclophilin family peptidyl-prolyl cis-trans isomerase